MIRLDGGHVFITHLIRKVVDIETVKTFSRPTDSAILLRYTHSSSAQRRKSIDLIDDIEPLTELTLGFEGIKKAIWS